MFKPLITGFFFTLLCLNASSYAINTEEEPKEQTEYSVNTFYALLVAEMAGQRQLFDLALGNYLLEAHRTQDPSITARATQIAQYIGADQAALDAATLWVKLDKNNPLGQIALSQELVKAARFSESVIHLQKALDAEPKLNVSFISLQGSSMTEGSRELWLESLSPLAQQYSDNQALLFNLANLHQQQANNKTAISLADQLLSVNPKFYPAWGLKARLESTLGNNEGALSTINKALDQFNNDKSFTLLKARLLIKNKQIPEARDAFKQIATAHPRDSQVLLPLALTLMELNEHDEAKATLQKLLNLHQMENEAHYYLGRIAQYQKDLKTALTHYQTMTAGREFLAAQNGIVQIHMVNDNPEAALDHIRDMRSKDIKHRQAYFLMEVDLLNRRHQYEESLTVLDEALTVYADNTDLRYSRAMVSEKLGDIAQLEKDLAYIIAKNPKNATALNALGYTLADHTERLDEALILIQAAQALSPKDPAIMDSLGWVYYRMGRTDESLKLLEDAYKVFPDPEVAAHLGEVLWQTGQHDKARDIWQEGLKKQPASKIINDTLDRLQVQL
jgi:tetratricopeptide (TPR) repeat protein